MAEQHRPKAWMLRITDQVEIKKRAAYEAAVHEVVSLLEQLLREREILSIRYINSARVSFGADVYEYVHHVRYNTLGDYENPEVQGSAVCAEIERVYEQELFVKSRWEFLEVIEESGVFEE